MGVLVDLVNEVKERQAVEAVERVLVGDRVPVGDERCGCWDPNAFHRRVGMRPGEICHNKGKPT